MGKISKILCVFRVETISSLNSSASLVFAQYLTRTLRAHASIVAYLSGVKTLHVLLNYSISGFQGFLLKLTLRGIRRNSTHIVHRAAPITPKLLKLIHEKIDHDDPEQAVLWGITLIGFSFTIQKV